MGMHFDNTMGLYDVLVVSYALALATDQELSIYRDSFPPTYNFGPQCQALYAIPSPSYPMVLELLTILLYLMSIVAIISLPIRSGVG